MLSKLHVAECTTFTSHCLTGVMILDLQPSGRSEKLDPTSCQCDGLDCHCNKINQVQHCTISQDAQATTHLYAPYEEECIVCSEAEDEIEDFARMLTVSLSEVGTSMPRVIKFCKRYDECSTMYRLFKSYLGEQFVGLMGLQMSQSTD